MVEEVTIKELLKRAGVDADNERYQELASYIAAHGVYAVDLTDDASESNASQTQSHLVFDPNSEEAKRYEPNPLELKGKLKEENKWPKPESTWLQVPMSMCRSRLLKSST